MKKISFLLVGLFLSLLFAGCEKDLDPVTPTPEVVNTPVIAVNYNTTDGCVTLNWDIKPAESVFLGATPVAIKGDTVICIKNDTTFVFTAENKGKKAKESFFVKANEIVLPLPTMILSVSPSTLPVGGGTVTVSGIAENATIVYYNGIGYDPAFSIPIGWIADDTIVSLMAVGPGGSKTFSGSINVEEPLPALTLLELLCLDHRSLDSSYYYRDSLPSVIYYLEVAPCEKDDDLQYFLNGECKYFMQGIFCEGGSPNIFVNNYTLVDSTVCAVNGGCADIVSISGDGSRMITKQKSWDIVGENSFPITIFKIYKF